VVVAQALRAFAYGFGALLLGTTLKARGLGSVEVGVVLGCVVAGTITTSVLVAALSDRWGRRRFYVALYVALAGAGVVYALSGNVVVLSLVALTGVLSTDIVDNGPFTSLEQAMLGTELARREQIRGFGLYNAIAAGAGALGALAARGPGELRQVLGSAPSDQRYFLMFVPVAAAGALVAASLSPRIEAAPPPSGGSRSRLGSSKPAVVRLAALFSADAFGGGFVVQAFIAYWFAAKYHTSLGTLAVIFFAVGVLQTVSFLTATRLAERFGLLSTMVFTHLPSNLLLIGIAFAPTLALAATLLLARSLLSQMDVPTRQAYVMALVSPQERTAAAGYTNTARYLVRPLGPVLGGAGQGLFFGLPFLAAGTIKTAYDLVLWRWFRSVPLPQEPETATAEPTPDQEQTADPQLQPQPFHKSRS
jgi:predicted MFS family arabinose efflux permease